MLPYIIIIINYDDEKPLNYFFIQILIHSSINMKLDYA